MPVNQVADIDRNQKALATDRRAKQSACRNTISTATFYLFLIKTFFRNGAKIISRLLSFFMVGVDRTLTDAVNLNLYTKNSIFALNCARHASALYVEMFVALDEDFLKRSQKKALSEKTISCQFQEIILQI